VKSTPASLGHKFRTDVLDKFEPDSVAALILLDRAAATLDEVCLLAEALESATALWSRGSNGQPVGHPALRSYVLIARRSRSSLVSVSPTPRRPLVKRRRPSLARGGIAESLSIKEPVEERLDAPLQTDL
jgi:hypothetical protein